MERLRISKFNPIISVFGSERSLDRSLILLILSFILTFAIADFSFGLTKLKII